MSWLRTSPLRQSFSRTNRSRSIDTAPTECDPKACYDSFCKHWQQIYEIILRAEVSVAAKLKTIVDRFVFYRFLLHFILGIEWHNEPRRCDRCGEPFGSYGHIVADGIAQLQ